MSAELFDTGEATGALTRAGLAESQARAIVATVREAVRGGVATKGDVDELKAELKGDIGEVRAEVGELRADIGEVKGEVGVVKAELRADIGEIRGEVGVVKAELKGDIAAVRGEVGAVKAELKGDIGEVRGAVKAELRAIEWVMGFMFAIVLAMAARLFGVV